MYVNFVDRKLSYLSLLTLIIINLASGASNLSRLLRHNLVHCRVDLAIYALNERKSNEV